VTLQVATQKGVDLNFTSVDLTLSLDDFSKRIIEPAMAVLAANIEADAMSMYKDVYQSIWNGGSAATYNKALDGRTILQRSLAPSNDRTANLNSLDMADLVKDTKTLFNDGNAIGKQYREGYMGRAAGFDFVENTMWAAHTRGGSNTAYLSNGATQSGATLAVDTGATAPSQGDVFTIAGVYSVHPETKVSTGILQQFVVGSGAPRPLGRSARPSWRLVQPRTSRIPLPITRPSPSSGPLRPPLARRCFIRKARSLSQLPISSCLTAWTGKPAKCSTASRCG
jgi:hypothetical protein